MFFLIFTGNYIPSARVVNLTLIRNSIESRVRILNQQRKSRARLNVNITIRQDMINIRLGIFAVREDTFPHSYDWVCNSTLD